MKNLLMACDCSMKHTRHEYDIFLYIQLAHTQKSSRVSNLFKILYTIFILAKVKEREIEW